jgi:hypothetical protein
MNIPLQETFSVNEGEGFWMPVGPGFKPGSQTCCKNHGFHKPESFMVERMRGRIDILPPAERV